MHIVNASYGYDIKLNGPMKCNVTSLFSILDEFIRKIAHQRPKSCMRSIGIIFNHN